MVNENRYPFRFRVNLRDPAFYDIQWKRDDAIRFQLTAWDTQSVGDIEGLIGVGAITATVRTLPNLGAAHVLQRACVGGGGHEALYDLVVLATDFADLTFDLGQPYRCLWMDLSASVSLEGDSYTVPVFDGAGNAIFPLRVHQTMGVGS